MIKNKLTIIVPLIGKYEKMIDKLDSVVSSLTKLENSVDIIIVSSNDMWTFSPQYKLLPIVLEKAKILLIEDKDELLSVLLNKAFENVQTEFAHVLLMNNLESIIDIERIIETMKVINLEQDKLYYITRANNNAGIYPSNQVNYGHIQIRKIYNLADLIISQKFIRDIKFNESLILKYDFDWEFALSVSRDFEFEGIFFSSIISEDIKKYPFSNVRMLPKGIVQRYILRCVNASSKDISLIESEKSFLRDVSINEFNKIIRFIKHKYSKNDYKSGKKYKIVILGGYWEYHHNQLCFLNYFEKMLGEGFCTYKIGFDDSSDTDFIRGSDLVIFTRCRSDNSIKLIEYCKMNQISSLYLIDDNWISIGKDYPEVYGNLFKEGNPNYDNFLKALKNCDITWCYNDFLCEDISKYAKRVLKFDINVEPDIYEANLLKSSNQVILGYAGSMRQSNEAFRAMSRIAKEFKFVKLMVMGILNEEQEKLFEGLNIIRMDFMPYVRYSKVISKISPDILLAPLDATRTSQSKCFNKFLESSVVGAAGVYSNVKPYSDVIKDSVNGFLIDDETDEGWYNKLKKILGDLDLLRDVQKNANSEVEEKYSTSKVINRFKDEIIKVVEGNYNE